MVITLLSLTFTFVWYILFSRVTILQKCLSRWRGDTTPKSFIYSLCCRGIKHVTCRLDPSHKTVPSCLPIVHWATRSWGGGGKVCCRIWGPWTPMYMAIIISTLNLCCPLNTFLRWLMPGRGPKLPPKSGSVLLPNCSPATVAAAPQTQHRRNSWVWIWLRG